MFREIFLEMGFAEMPTQQYVESSFWNFDALYQPQQHPARDAHDTFFIKTPAQTRELPADYMERVRTTHEARRRGAWRGRRRSLARTVPEPACRWAARG